MSPRTLQDHLPGICVGDSLRHLHLQLPLHLTVFAERRSWQEDLSTTMCLHHLFLDQGSPDMFTILHTQDDLLVYEFVSSLLSLVCFSHFDCQLFPVLYSRSSPDSHFSAQYLIHCPHITAVSVWVPLKADPET